jgi:hypothetical protein
MTKAPRGARVGAGLRKCDDTICSRLMNASVHGDSQSTLLKHPQLVMVKDIQLMPGVYENGDGRGLGVI